MTPIHSGSQFLLLQCFLQDGFLQSNAHHEKYIEKTIRSSPTNVISILGRLQVYYLPLVPFYNKSILPTIVGSLPILRHYTKSDSLLPVTKPYQWFIIFNTFYENPRKTKTLPVVTLGQLLRQNFLL